jgi:recombination protein RecA
MKEEILARLDPKTRARLQAASEIQLERVPTPSLGLNLALNGGFVAGRQVLVWGNKSAGKSSAVLQMMGEAQKAGKTCAWIDAEQSYDPTWAKRLGVNNDEMIVSHSRGVAKIADECVDLVSSGIDILCIDSISQILPTSYFEKDGEDLKEFEKTGQIGTFSKDIGRLSNMVGSVNEKTLFILISQQRTKITPTYSQMVPQGGESVKFNSSTVIKLWSSESDNNAIMGETSRGDQIIKDKVGREVSWEVEWNKTGPMWRNGKYDFFFMGDNVGIDQCSEIVRLGLEAGLIKKSGSWLDLGFAKVQGVPAAADLFRADPEKFQLFADTIEAGYV